jgi:3,4-dihydroxy 2-butanone 4-phosphate synthase/GTP cyclohydrolase II
MSTLELRTSFGRGAPIVVLDETSEASGHLVISAALIEPTTMAFTVRHTSGLVHVALPAMTGNALGLPAMTATVEADRRPVPAVTVDASEGISTGISAADRTHTARLLADSNSTLEHFKRPGHLMPLRVSANAMSYPSPSAAGLVLAQSLDLPRAVVHSVLVCDRGPLMNGRQAVRFADEHRLAVITLTELMHMDRLLGVA